MTAATVRKDWNNGQRPVSKRYLPMIEIFRDVKVNWLGKRKLYLAISGSVMLLGLVSLVVKHGFRYGVDFRRNPILKKFASCCVRMGHRTASRRNLLGATMF